MGPYNSIMEMWQNLEALMHKHDFKVILVSYGK